MEHKQYFDKYGQDNAGNVNTLPHGMGREDENTHRRRGVSGAARKKCKAQGVADDGEFVLQVECVSLSHLRNTVLLI